MEKRKLLRGVAEFSSLGRDLFWKFYCFNDNNEFVRVRWQGYSDSYWWDVVSKTDQACIRKGSDGRYYKINFSTNEVEEVEDAEDKG